MAESIDVRTAQAAFRPERVLEIELSEPLQALPAFDSARGRRYERALAFVRLHTQPLGCVELPLDEGCLSPAELAEAVWHGLSAEINAHLAADGLAHVDALDSRGLATSPAPRCLAGRSALLAAAPLASIVVATRDRPESLVRCLESLLALDYPDYEIVLVDSAPSTRATAEIVGRFQDRVVPVRYACEPRPGLARARNRALEVVRAGIVAFTDDDVVVDRYWLAELAGALLSSEDVACATGMILPMELDTVVQAWAQQYWAFGKGFERRVFDLDEHRPSDPLYPFTPGIFGAGANIAFRTEALVAMGGYDAALGTGSAARGGCELAAFLRVLARGHQLVYAPAALLYHRNYPDYARLRRQAYIYGLGLTAALTGALMASPTLIPSFVSRVPRGVAYALSPRSAKNARKPASYPRALRLIEYLGMLLGPFAYARSRWQTRGTNHLPKRLGALMPASALRGGTR